MKRGSRRRFVDIGKGTVTSEEHVDVKLLNGTLTADRLRITGGGEVVRFEGNVVLNLDRLGDDNASGQPANPPAAAEPAPPIPSRRGQFPANPPTRNDLR